MLTVADMNDISRSANRLSDLNGPLRPILHEITGLPFPNFPASKAELSNLTNPQLAAALGFYGQLVGGQRSVRYTRFCNFIGIN